jgi:hypothetical protein
MAGGIVMVVLLVVVIPVAVIISGGILAGIIGWALTANGEKSNEGSELIETNI